MTVKIFAPSKLSLTFLCRSICRDLMIEISLAVRSVLSNELPKMVRHSISESLYELINSTADTSANNVGALEAKPGPGGGKKNINTKNKSIPICPAPHDRPDCNNQEPKKDGY